LQNFTGEQNPEHCLELDAGPLPPRLPEQALISTIRRQHHEACAEPTSIILHKATDLLL